MAGGSLGEQTDCVNDRWVWEDKPLCKPKGYAPEFYEPHVRSSFVGEVRPWLYGAAALIGLWLIVRLFEAYKR